MHLESDTHIQDSLKFLRQYAAYRAWYLFVLT